MDELAAEAIDRQLKRLASNHWHVIRLHYYRHRPQRELELQAAVRALSDLG